MRCHLAFFLIILLLAGCHKDDTPTHYVPKELKDLYLFRPGSYWTMRDSLTGRVDSFFVTRVDSSISRYSTGYFEDNYVNIKEVNVDGTHTADSAYYGFHLQGAGVSFQYTDWLFLEDMHYEGGWDPEQIHSVFTCLGLNYYSVNEYNHKAILYIGFHNSDGIIYPNDYFLNKMNGFVKIRTNTKYRHFVWELLNGHIIR